MPAKVVICDEPDCLASVVTQTKIGEQARAAARDKGWQSPDHPHTEGPDYCPEHRK